MNEKEMLLQMYNKYSEQIPAQFSRRQTDNRYFLAICLAIFGGLGWMIDNCFVDTHPSIIVAVCLLGLLICASWAATLCLYESSLTAKYKILRQMEAKGFPYPLYDKDKEFRDKVSCCKDFLKFFRHRIPIIFFALIFLFSPFYLLIQWKQ